MSTDSPFVSELDHLVRRTSGSLPPRGSFPTVADGDYRLAAVTNDDLLTAAEVRSLYAGLELDLADAVGVVLADRHRTNRVFTLDQRDFRVIRPLTPGFDHFTILPADA